MRWAYIATAGPFSTNSSGRNAINLSEHFNTRDGPSTPPPHTHTCVTSLPVATAPCPTSYISKSCVISTPVRTNGPPKGTERNSDLCPSVPCYISSAKGPMTFRETRGKQKEHAAVDRYEVLIDLRDPMLAYRHAFKVPIAEYDRRWGYGEIFLEACSPCAVEGGEKGPDVCPTFDVRDAVRAGAWYRTGGVRLHQCRSVGWILQLLLTRGKTAV